MRVCHPVNLLGSDERADFWEFSSAEVDAREQEAGNQHQKSVCSNLKSIGIRKRVILTHEPNFEYHMCISSHEWDPIPYAYVFEVDRHTEEGDTHSRTELWVEFLLMNQMSKEHTADF